MIASKTFRNVFFIFMIMLVASFYSCTTTRVVTKYDSDTFANNQLNAKTTWSYFWGLVQPKDIHPSCDQRFNHLDQVTVKNNFGFVIISFCSLGIVMPQRVEWSCAPYSPPTDSLGHN